MLKFTPFMYNSSALDKSLGNQPTSWEPTYMLGTNQQAGNQPTSWEPAYMLIAYTCGEQKSKGRA